MSIQTEKEYIEALEKIDHIWNTYEALDMDVNENKEFLSLILEVEKYETEELGRNEQVVAV